MTQYGFYFDSTRCTGCRTCVIACKDYKDLDQEHAFRRVYDYEGGRTEVADDGTVTTSAYAYHVSSACNHCEEPACLKVCPGGAIRRREDDNIIYLDKKRCDGLQRCLDKCPYGMIVWFEDRNQIDKCDMCADRIDAGLKPVCVDACPMRALEFGDIDELRVAHPDAVDAIAPLPDPGITLPSVCIEKSPAAREWDDKDGAVTNEEEVEGAPAWK